MRTITVKIAAGAAEELAVKGDYVRVKLAPYDVKIENTDAGEVVEASQGDDFELSKFHSLRVTNLGAVDSVFKFTIATGKRAGSAPGVISGSVAIDAASLAALETVNIGNKDAVNGAFAQIRGNYTNVNAGVLVADAARRYLLIQNNDNAQTLRVVFGGAASATQGVRLPPGAHYELNGFVASNSMNVCYEAATVPGTNNVEVVTG